MRNEETIDHNVTVNSAITSLLLTFSKNTN